MRLSRVLSPTLIAVLALTASAPVLAATASDLEPAFKGTVVTTYSSGRVAKLWLNRDGSYDGARTNGERTRGRWALKGEKLCLINSKVLMMRDGQVIFSGTDETLRKADDKYIQKFLRGH